MRTYKGQAFEPTVTPRRRKPKPKPLKLRTAPNRDKLLRPKGKRPARALLPAGRKGQPRGGRPTPGRTGGPAAPPVDPFAADVEAALKLKYGDQTAALEGEARTGPQQHANVQGWYQGYLDDLQTAAQMTSQAYGQGQQATYDQANLGAGQDQTRMAQNQQQAQQSAALRGTSAGAQPEQAAAIGARQASTTNFGSFLAAQGGAAATLDAGRYAAGAAARVGAHERESAREAEVRAGARKLMAERAADQVTLRSELKDQEFKRQLLLSQFGEDVREQTADEKKAERDRRQRERSQKRTARGTRRGQRVTRQNAIRTAERLAAKDAAAAELLAWQKAHGTGPYAPAKDEGGPSKYTPTQKRAYKQNYDSALATLESTYQIKGGKFSLTEKGKTYTYTVDEMVKLIVADKNIPPAIARVAVYRALGRPIPKPLSRKARGMGVPVKPTKKTRSPIGEGIQQVGDLFDRL